MEQAHKDYEQSQSDIKSAESDISSNETVLKASRDHLVVFGKTDAEIEKIEKAHIIDRNTRVLAPISGSIIQRKAGLGQYVKPDNPDPIFVIADLSTMWMLADVYESDSGSLKLHSLVEVGVLAYPNDPPFKAEIAYISPSVDPNTHRIAVRCEVKNDGLRLKSDMFATFPHRHRSVRSAVAGHAAGGNRSGRTEESRLGGRKGREPVRPPRSRDRRAAEWLRSDHFRTVKAGETIAADGSLFLSNKASTD